MSPWSWKFGTFWAKLRPYFPIRRGIPAELEKSFEEFKDIRSIDRLHVAAWLGVFLTFCLFGLDYNRHITGAFKIEQDHYYYSLVWIHAIGLFYFIPAIHITRRKNWIKEARLRRGVVIWGMVVLTFAFLLTQALIVYFHRGTTTVYLGFIFIGSWMFAMTHKERSLFFFISLAAITWCIIVRPEKMFNDYGFYAQAAIEDARIVSFIEVFFLSIVAFFFDAYDYNQKLENFFNLRQIEREQKRISDLESFKSRFFTNLTHEFRTPLTLIMGMSREIAEDPRRWVTEGTQMISENARNLLTLINQILDLSKVENEAIPLRMVQGDIVSYLSYIVDSFKGNAIARQIEIHYLCPEEQIIMDYDPAQWATIITNLLSNAVKFSADGENIYLSLSYHPERDKEEVEIIVQDHGVGIPKEELSHIFERFYQVQSTQSLSRIGSGVGLALVRELVSLLHGEISVVSTLGKGSQFKVRLPVTRKAPMLDPILHEDGRISMPFDRGIKEQISEDQENGLTDQSKPEILILEDNPDVIKYLRICLQDFYRLTISKNGEEGIAQAIKNVPDIILSDVLMPVKDGIAVCKELKQNSITSHIPILLLSAKADADSRIAGLEAGADVYLVKPFDKNELRAQILNLLHRFAEYHQRYSNPEVVLAATDDAHLEVEDEFIIRIRNLIHEHLDNNEFSVHDLERGVFLSRSQLHKKLKALTGLSAMQYVSRIRLSVAREKLRTESGSISDIAYQVGYSDPNYFSRAYSEEFGETPSETRNHHKKSVL
jgi:signal transduction histidine kinase/DNA-binding response OmpR family regulator